MLTVDLKNRIKRSGPLSFSDFVESCLYDLDEGFYTKREKKEILLFLVARVADLAEFTYCTPGVGKSGRDTSIGEWEES